MLFRAEALKAQQRKLHGDVFLTQSIPLVWITYIVVAIIALITILLFFGSYARTEHVTGHLVPSKGLVKIKASQFGSLGSLFIAEGSLVEAGDKLAIIKISQSNEYGSYGIEESIISTDNQIKNNMLLVSLEQKNLKSKLAKIRADQAETLAAITVLEQRVTLQVEITASAGSAFRNVQKLLEKGFVSKVESKRRYQAWLTQQVQSKQLEQELTTAKTRVKQLKIRLKQIPHESEERVIRLQSQHADLIQRKLDYENRKSYQITSPVNGKIVSISNASIGRSVVPQQLLFTILPEGSKLEVELFVPSRAAGFAEKGQEVRIMYDAFPYQRFGSFPAIITKVTESILAPNEIITPFELREPVYRVTAAINDDKVQARGKSISLQPGMMLKANIVLERRSFLNWLLAPLKAVGEQS